jgi:acyl carrier protein
MGLDTVELILTFEEVFDIELPDSEMEKVATPREVANYIYSYYLKEKVDKQQEAPDSECSSQKRFYFIRRLLIDAFGFDRSELHPSTKIQNLFGEHVREYWKKLKEIMPDQPGNYTTGLPGLSLPKIIFYPMTFFSLLLTFIAVYTNTQWAFTTLIWVAIGTFLIVQTLMYFLLQPRFGTIVPSGYETLSSLIRFVDYRKSIYQYKSYDDILEKVIEISIEQLNLSPDEITPDSRYAEDLGCD